MNKIKEVNNLYVRFIKIKLRFLIRIIIIKIEFRSYIRDRVFQANPFQLISNFVCGFE